MFSCYFVQGIINNVCKRIIFISLFLHFNTNKMVNNIEYTLPQIPYLIYAFILQSKINIQNFKNSKLYDLLIYVGYLYEDIILQYFTHSHIQTMKVHDHSICHYSLAHMACTYHLLKKQRSNSLDISRISLMGIQMPFHTCLSNQLHKHNYAV